MYKRILIVTSSHSPEWQRPVETVLNGTQFLYTTPLPGSGHVLSYILNILDGFLDIELPFSVRNMQRIIESFKFAYGMRTKLGDQRFLNISEVPKFLKRIPIEIIINFFLVTQQLNFKKICRRNETIHF